MNDIVLFLFISYPSTSTLTVPVTIFSCSVQHVEVITPSEKLRRLEQILRSQDSGSKVLIFCTTKRMCDQLARTLTRQFGASAIHGDKSQSEREKVLNQFRSGRSPILVATDVAARGLDIKDIRLYCLSILCYACLCS
jgi:ATP-dependent RNA helicase DDX5/DBP2